MVREQYLRQLDVLRESVISFGKMVELIFCDSIDAFIDLDIKVAKRVLVLAAKMDKYEEGIEVSISDMLALQQPMASDLRLIISALKISAELKRISKLSINIAKVPGKIKGEHVRYLMDIKKMSDIATYMLENSLKAF
jgi:phosphate transport system protein